MRVREENDEVAVGREKGKRMSKERGVMMVSEGL